MDVALLPNGSFDANAEGLRHLRYTEVGALNYYSGEDLVDQFHKPEAVQAVLAKYFPEKKK